jgi:hypothetical protein
MPSRCGANCSFTLTLDMPYLDCSISSFNVSFAGNSTNFEFPVFNATWEGYVFNATTYYVFNASDTPNSNAHAWIAHTKANNTICTPSRANYVLYIEYENAVQRRSFTKSPATPLNVSSPALSSSAIEETPPSLGLGPAVLFPGFMGITTDAQTWWGTEALNWTPSLISWYRDLQLMAIISGMANSLSGNVSYTHPGIGMRT